MAYKIKNKDGSIRKHNDNEVYATDVLNVVKAVDMEKRTLKIVATDETVDRDGDIISMKGWNIENYLKNPVFLWAHDYSSVPLAAAVKLVRRMSPVKQMVMTHKFPTKGIFPFADMILDLYNEKVINAGSVGFIVHDSEKIEWDDEEQKPDNATPWGRRFLKQELLEHSGCAVPANPNALQEAMKGFGYDEKSGIYLYMNENVQLEVADKVKEQVENELLPYLDKGPEVEEETSATKVQVPMNYSVASEELIAPDEWEELEQLTLEEIEAKPYKHEHACRLKEPGQFDSFARKNCAQKHDDKCIDVIYGIKDNKSQIQALRYKKNIWTAATAKSHCGDRGGKFEAAANDSYEIDAFDFESFCEKINAETSFDDTWSKWFSDFGGKNPFQELKLLFEEITEQFMAKSLGEQVEEYRKRFDVLLKAGAVLNRKNKARLKQVLDLVTGVLEDAGALDDGDGQQTDALSDSAHEDVARNDAECGFVAGDYFADCQDVKQHKKVKQAKGSKRKEQLATMTAQVEHLLKEVQRVIAN